MDIALVETGNGGDFEVKDNDIVLYLKGENNPYLGLFGGNVDQITPKQRVNGEQDLSYWGNALLFSDEPSQQMNSEVEKAFNEIPLTSSGRISIENIVKQNLAFLKPLGEVKVKVLIVDTDRITIILNWFTLEGVGKTTRINVVKSNEGDDGDFFQMDFNDDFF
jgi:hypothetical protein